MSVWRALAASSDVKAVAKLGVIIRPWARPSRPASATASTVLRLRRRHGADLRDDPPLLQVRLAQLRALSLAAARRW